MTQLEQLLGLHPNTIAANQLSGAGNSVGPNAPANSSMQPFLSELASLFTNQHGLPGDLNVNKPSADHMTSSGSADTGNKAPNTIQSVQDSSVPPNLASESVIAGFDSSTPTGGNEIFKHETPPPNVISVKNPKNVNISNSLDKSVDLNKSESKNNQTVSKRIRTINIKTTITKKHKPVSPAPNLIKGGGKSTKSNSNGASKGGNTSNSLTNIAGGQQQTLTGLAGTQNTLGVNDPARTRVRAEMIDTIMDNMGEGMELMGGLMALNSMNEMAPNSMFLF